MRLLSSLALLASAASAAVLPSGPKAIPRQTAAVNEGYVFAYFRDNSIAGEKIFLAASKGNNALDWQELNNGNPILTSTKGTKGLRDPFLIKVRPEQVLGKQSNADRTNSHQMEALST